MKAAESEQSSRKAGERAEQKLKAMAGNKAAGEGATDTTGDNSVSDLFAFLDTNSAKAVDSAIMAGIHLSFMLQVGGLLRSYFCLY